MSTARVAGLAALQSGDVETAVTQLETAVQEDPSDFDACLYLGAAYGQAGRQLDAIKSITQAVQLQPANAQARYNLGVAMEQGGYIEQALQVYNQVIQLQPDYPNAKEAIDRLHETSTHGFGAPVGAISASGSGQQPREEPAQPQPQATQQFAQPAAFGQQQQQPAAFNPLAQPAQQQQPYNPLAPPQQSAQPTQAFARPTIPVGQPQQPAEAGLGSYMAPPPPQAARAPGGYGAPPAYGARPGAYSSVPTYDDEFKLGQAFKDFFRALFSPRSLFSEMAGCETVKSTWALFIWYAIFTTIVAGVNYALHSSAPSMAPPILTFVFALLGIPILLIIWAIFAGIVQMLARAFGSSLRYGASFRCVMYAAAPYMVSTLVLSIASGFIMPQMQSAVLGASGGNVSTYQTPTSTSASTKKSTGKSGGKGKSGSSSNSSSGTSGGQFGSGSSSASPFPAGSPFGTSGGAYSGGQFPGGPMSGGPNAANPFAALQAMAGFLALLGSVMLVGVIWGVSLLGVAVANVHEISSGGAAGVAILSAIIAFVLAVGAYIVFAAAIFAMIMGSMPH